MWPETGRPRRRASAITAWLLRSPRATLTKSIFSPSPTASGQRSKILPILSGVRSPPAVSKRGLGVGACRHHRALDVDVRVHEARRHDPPESVEPPDRAPRRPARARGL